MEKQARTPKVLVVDDDPDLAALCSFVLENEGYDIDIARNGHEAYAAIAAKKIDVVLLDIMMPVLDGITVCKMVKRDPRTKDVPVIMMSASDRLRDHAKSSPADAVIQKPFDLDHLINTVHHFAYGN